MHKHFLLFILIFISLSPIPASSAENQYTICSTSGFFRGLDNKFMSGLTSHILTRKNILNNPECIKKHDFAFTLGRSLLAGDNVDGEENIKIINNANNFRDKVYKMISTKMGY